jgi:hypothetical protein
MYFVVMPRVNLIVILSTYAHYLCSINCPTVICLPSMSLFILWRDTTSELWTPVLFSLHCYHLFSFSHTTIAFHSIRSFLCLQQTGEIDNLTVSWEQSTWFCCVQVPRCCWQSKALDKAPYKLLGAVAKLAGITFWSLAFSWTDKPWFLTEGKTCCCAHHTFLLGFPTGR